jgi:hypothetical protein
LALDRYAGYADYELRAGDRTIPLIRLERAGQSRVIHSRVFIHRLGVWGGGLVRVV